MNKIFRNFQRSSPPSISRLFTLCNSFGGQLGVMLVHFGGDSPLFSLWNAFPLTFLQEGLRSLRSSWAFGHASICYRFVFPSLQLIESLSPIIQTHVNVCDPAESWALSVQQRELHENIWSVEVAATRLSHRLPGMPYLLFTALCEKVRRQAENGMFWLH